MKERVNWIRGGTVQEVIWIGTDTLGWTAGPYIVFYDVPGRILTLPKFSLEDTKTGVCCLSGHPTRGLFAFVDKSPNPQIHIHTFPNLERQSICVKQSSHAYVATAFVHDYLVSIGSLPDFLISVWSWRSGTKLITVKSTIFDAENFGQSLRMSYFPRTYIAQIGNTSGSLCVWEMIISRDTVILNKNDIELPNRALVRDCAWRPDSTFDVLAIVDRDGHIYLSNPTGTDINRIVLSQRCSTCLEIEPAAICWFRGGLVLRTTFCQIRYYHKDTNANKWKMMWFHELKTDPCVLTSHPFRFDRVYFFTKQGHIVQIVFNDKLDSKLEERHFKGGRFRFLSFVHPWNKHLVTIDSSMNMVTITANEGARVFGFPLHLHGVATSMISHHEYPLVSVATDCGEVAFVSLFYYHKPKILAKFLMQSEPLHLMKFSKTGRYEMACDKEQGNFYFFSVHYTDPIQPIAMLEFNSKVTDALCFDLDTPLKVLLLHNILPDLNSVGNRITIYELDQETNEFKNPPNVFEFAQYYSFIHHVPGEVNMFVAQPCLKKQLHFYKSNDWKEDIVCVEMIPNGHNLRKINMGSSKRWIASSSINGTLVVRGQYLGTKKNKQQYPIQITIFSNHVQESRVLKIAANYSGTMVLVLGNDGMLVNLATPGLEQVKSSDMSISMKSPKKANFEPSVIKAHHIKMSKKQAMFLRRMSGKKVNFRAIGILTDFDHDKQVAEYAKTMEKKMIEFLLKPSHPFSSDPKMTWVEWRRAEQIELERSLHVEEKKEIMEEFQKIKESIVELLDKNETTQEISRLPVAMFSLDSDYRERMIKAGKDDREEVRTRLETECQQRERISNWIHDNLWNTQKTLFQSIYGIFNDTEVTNYTISKENYTDPEEVEYSAFCRHVVNNLIEYDSINLWDNRTPEELNEVFGKHIKVLKEPESDHHLEDHDLVKTETEIVASIEPEEELNARMFGGLTAYKYIDMSDYYDQFRCYAYSQLKVDNDAAAKDSEKLMIFFNEKFDEITGIKEREMKEVEERVDRINFIIDELKEMYDMDIAEKLQYPKWHMKEKAENIIQVSSSEVEAEIYLSPSELDLLNKQKEEEERARLAKLADDFRERALKQMMDGVLEVRWEDIIKKDIPKPEILLTKDPDEYTEEERNAVNKYEKEVEAREEDRIQYRKTLLSDYAKVSSAMKDSIDKFNARIHEFFLLKMNVESAIKQLEMRRVRFSVRHMHRVRELKEVDEAKKTIKEKYNLVSKLAEDTKHLKSVELELNEFYENQDIKDKYLEKKLKNDFSSLGKNAFEVINKQYKRRPRIFPKTTSRLEILDLAKSVTIMFKPTYLTGESLDYLKQLDQLDVRPHMLPPIIENSTWHHLVSVRRQKISQELRVHMGLMELDQLNHNLSFFSDKLTAERSAIEALRNHLVKSRTTRVEWEIDNEVQLVLKYGHVENKKLNGEIDEDTLNIVLIPKVTIETVNAAILANGARKVEAVEKLLEFRKEIVAQKWEYSRLETRIRHSGALLYYTKTTNVTRSMLQFMKRKALKLKDDRTEKKLEKDFETYTRLYEKLLADQKKKMNEKKKEIKLFQRKNVILDARIEKLNLDRCEMELARNYEGEARHKLYQDRVFELIALKSRLIKKLVVSRKELKALTDELSNVECTKGMLIIPDEDDHEDKKINSCHCGIEEDLYVN